MVSNFAAAPQEEVSQKKISSSQIFEAIVSFFKEDNWSFLQDEDLPILRMNYQGKNGSWRCMAQSMEERNVFIFYSSSPVTVPEDKLLSAAEFLMRVNYGLILGNFELDFRSGQIYYKTATCTNDIHLNYALIERVVYANLGTMDKYLPGIMKVIYADVPAAEALAQIEG